MRHAATLRLAVILLAIFSGSGGRITASALPPGYFPSETRAPADIDGWRRLATEHPLLIRIEEPATTVADDNDSGTAAATALGARTVYLRVRDLARDLPAVEQALASPRLVLDLRFTTSGAAESLHFGRLLARLPVSLPPPATDAEAIEIQPAGARAPDQITVVLVNGETRGAVEAVLAALQMRGEILLTGTTTAGDTGAFQPVAETPGIHVIRGEYRPAAGVSILGEGVQPRLAVDVSDADDQAAYGAFFEDTPLSELLDPTVDKARLDEAALLERHGKSAVSRRAARETASSDSATEEAPPRTDRILQRGVNALIAHDALGGQ